MSEKFQMMVLPTWNQRPLCTKVPLVEVQEPSAAKVNGTVAVVPSQPQSMLMVQVPVGARAAEAVVAEPARPRPQARAMAASSPPARRRVFMTFLPVFVKPIVVYISLTVCARLLVQMFEN